MVVNSQTHAIMLLTVSFGKADGAESRPLSVGEWARFAVWLRDNGLNPSDLLNGSLKTLLAGWVDRSITVPRLETLMGRGSTLGLVLEKWQRAGLWVMTRSDLDYPERLKRRLRSESPPVLFGCGERRLLESQGIAIVGSRDATDDDLRFAEHLRKASSGPRLWLGIRWSSRSRPGCDDRSSGRRRYDGRRVGEQPSPVGDFIQISPASSVRQSGPGFSQQPGIGVRCGQSDVEEPVYLLFVRLRSSSEQHGPKRWHLEWSG